MNFHDCLIAWFLNVNLIDSRPLSVFQHSPKNDAVIQTIIKPVAFLVTPHFTGLVYVMPRNIPVYQRENKSVKFFWFPLRFHQIISIDLQQHLITYPLKYAWLMCQDGFACQWVRLPTFPIHRFMTNFSKKILKTWAHTPKEKYWLKTIFPTTRSSQDPQQQKVNARTQPDAFVDARPYPYFLICKHFIPSLKTVTSLKMLTTNIGIVDNYRRKCWFFTKILSGPSALRSKYLLLFWLFLFGVTDQ